MSAPSELTPSIPPRPVRSKTPVEAANAEPEAPSAPANMPSIPPRPSRRPGMPTTASNEGLATPEPTVTTISPSMELHQPAPIPVVKPDAEELRKQTTTTSSEAGESRPISRTESRISENQDSGVPKDALKVPLEKDAGEVQAPTPPAVPKVNRNALKDVYKQGNYGEYSKTGSVERIERNNLARSAVDLNESVQKALGGSGVGTHRDAQPVPDEDMAYLASDDFTSRMMSPEPTDAKAEHHNVIHIDPHDSRRSQATTPTPFSHISRPHSRAHSRLGNRDLVEEEEFLDETTGTPILASDEIQKSKSSPGTPYVPRAMSPAFVEVEKPEEKKEESDKPTATSQGSDTEEVEKHSLGGGYTPLKKDEDLEPLFPDEEDEEPAKEGEKALTPEPKAVRPGLRVLGKEKSRFPSQDVWEDAPEFSNLETVVSDPGEVRRTGEEEQDEESSRLPVVPRKGHSRRPSTELKGSVTGYPHEAHEDAYPQDGRSKDRIPVAHKSHVSIPQSSLRPEATKAPAKVKQRFPSADVWEDAPDSTNLSATVTPAPPEQEEEEPVSPVETKSPIATLPPVVQPVKREPSPEKPKTRPPPPTKPKPPTIPPRPKKLVAPPVVAEKPKPAVPPKQPGKLLKTSFLGDLNSRLAKGPGALLGLKKEEKTPEAEEPPKSEEPLVDVRKSRTRGPRGRKPPTASTTTSILKESSSERPRYVGVWTIYEADENGEPIPGTGITKSMTPAEIEKVIADKSRKQVDFVLPEAKAEKAVEKPVEEVPKEAKEEPKVEEPKVEKEEPKVEESKVEEAKEQAKEEPKEEPKAEESEPVKEEPKEEKEAEVAAAIPTPVTPAPAEVPAEKDTEQALPLTTDEPEKEIQEKTNTVVEQAEEKIEENVAQKEAPVVESEPTKEDAEAVQDETPVPAQEEETPAPICAKPFQPPVEEEEVPAAAPEIPSRPVAAPTAAPEIPARPAGEEAKILGEEAELGQGGRQEEPKEEKKALIEATAGPGVENDGLKKEDAQ